MPRAVGATVSGDDEEQCPECDHAMSKHFEDGCYEDIGIERCECKVSG